MRERRRRMAIRVAIAENPHLAEKKSSGTSIDQPKNPMIKIN
jgi:hypothetical protein